MLRISNLFCHYGVICALNDISLNIESNDITAILGCNGAGKSTLMKTIIGIKKPSSGLIEFFGEEITGLSPHLIIRKGISLCPEGRRIFKQINVLENLLAGAYIIKDKNEINKNIDRVFNLFPKLSERKKQIAGTLSGGELQMLAIGRALMSKPKLLLFDEPSMGLAPNLIKQVFEAINQINKTEGIPVIIVEQNAKMALSIAKYAYVLEVGNLILQGKGADLIKNKEIQNKYLGV